MTRLFISVPDPLPESLDGIAWRLLGAGQPPTRQDAGLAASAADLPEADEIWLALPAGRVLLSSLTLPRRALRQLNGALGNALEDKLMLDPTLVHVAIGKPLTGDEHPVAVIETAWLEQLLALCRRHGIEPFGATSEALLWLGDAAQTWSVRWSGHQGFVRSGPNAGFALDDGNAQTPPLALQLALAEARRQGVAPDALMVEAEVAVDAVAWSRSLECPLKLHALYADPQAPGLNLLQGPYASRRRGSSGWLAANLAEFVRSRQFGRYRLAAGLVAAALAVHVLGTLGDWLRLSQENRQLRAEMRQVFQEVFPQTQAIVDPSLQMQRQLADLRRAHGYVESGDFLHALGAVAGQVGGVKELSYENNHLTLAQPLAADLDALRTTLAAQGYRMSSAGEAGNQSVTLERSRP